MLPAAGEFEAQLLDREISQYPYIDEKVVHMSRLHAKNRRKLGFKQSSALVSVFQSLDFFLLLSYFAWVGLSLHWVG